MIGYSNERTEIPVTVATENHEEAARIENLVTFDAIVQSSEIAAR